MKTKLNVRLLRRIQKHILAEPKRYNQNDIVSTGKPGEAYSFAWRFPACGTIACIGGWAAVLSSGGRHEDLEYGARALGLTVDQRARLFSATGNGGWPDKFDIAYTNAKTPQGRARVGARRIEHFIKTKGAE